MALSHIVLHLTLCQAATRLKTGAAMPLSVSVTDRIDRPIVNQQFRLVRDFNNISSVEFDMPRGVYRLDAQASVGKTMCSAEQYFAVIVDHNRSLNMTLQNGTHHPVPVPMLFTGTAPFAYAYAQPTIVFFDHNQQCKAPVGQPLDAELQLFNDADGYYGEVYPSPNLLAHEPVMVAVRLTDARGDYKYMRLENAYIGASRWPGQISFNVDDGVMQYVAGEAEDTLLCPKLMKTSVGGA